MQKKSLIVILACAILLICVSLALLFLLRDDGSGEPTPDTEANSLNTTESDSESIYVTSEGVDSESEATDDFDLDFGKTISVLCWEDAAKQEFSAHKDSDDVLEAAVYQRNKSVESDLGVVLSFDPQKGGAAHVNAFVKKLENSFESSSEYDLVAAYSRAAGQCVVKGLLADISETEYIDLDDPWYPERLKQDLSVGGSLYFVTGDASANTVYGMYAIFYNKDLVDRLGLCDPALLVDTKQWTLDKLIEMSVEGCDSLNGEGGSDTLGGENYGFCTIYYGVDSFYTGAGLRLVETNLADPILRLSGDYSGEEAVALSSRLGAWLSSDSCNVFMQEGNFREPFINGTAIFCQDRLSFAQDYLADNGALDFNYGILPVPSAYAEEDGYITCLASTFTLYGIPFGCDDGKLDMMSAVIESWSQNGYRYTSPAVFERVMGRKYTDGGSDASVFDLCRRTATSDLGRIFALELENMSEVWSRCACNDEDWYERSKLRAPTLRLKLVELSSQITENAK